MTDVRLYAANVFTTIDHDRPLRLAVVGAGGMGRGWLRLVSSSSHVELAAVVDLNESAAKSAVTELEIPDTPVFSSLTEAASVGPDAVVDVTIPAAHYPVTMEAIGLGLHVIGEKPLAATLSESYALVDAAHKAERLFMVSQNRRYNRHLYALKAHAERLGGVGIVVHEFFKAPRFGGFRDAMAHPLVLDMAIHNFDALRFLLDADPVAVYCEEYNPSWSWYDGAAATTAIFEMTGGTRFIYTGSWCSDGLETAWDSRWRVSGRHGSALWDGSSEPQSELTVTAEPVDAPTPPAEGIAGSLADFVSALRTGVPPRTECGDNVLSLAMVYAAIESATTGQRVRVDDVIGAARSA